MLDNERSCLTMLKQTMQHLLYKAVTGTCEEEMWKILLGRAEGLYDAPTDYGE